MTQLATDSTESTRADLLASKAMVRASDPKAVPLGGMMPDLSSAAAGGLLAKFLPAGIGAALMVAVDPPESKRELFARLFVAFACSYLFGDVALDLLHSFSWFAFLDATKRAHTNAVDGIVGAAGWFVMGGFSHLLQRFRVDPVGTVDEAKKVLP